VARRQSQTHVQISKNSRLAQLEKRPAGGSRNHCANNSAFLTRRRRIENISSSISALALGSHLGRNLPRRVDSHLLKPRLWTLVCQHLISPLLCLFWIENYGAEMRALVSYATGAQIMTGARAINLGHRHYIMCARAHILRACKNIHGVGLWKLRVINALSYQWVG
jgi:hypothetical protein